MQEFTIPSSEETCYFCGRTPADFKDFLNLERMKDTAKFRVPKFSVYCARFYYDATTGELHELLHEIYTGAIDNINKYESPISQKTCKLCVEYYICPICAQRFKDSTNDADGNSSSPGYFQEGI